jgi:hypothetical protein
LKVASESFTVVPHPADGEISLLIGGLKIVLDLDEARALTAQLISGMKAICRVERVGDRIVRNAPAELAVVEAPLGVAAARPAVGVPADGEASPDAPAPAFLPLKERGAEEAAGNGDGKAEAAPVALALTAIVPPPPAEIADERDKKSGKKLRSLFKALVKEDDNSFSGGL